MGFWNTLVNTAANVANWVGKNSGSIASAAGTIAKIAGLVAATEEEEEQAHLFENDGDGNILPSLVANISRAERALTHAANHHFKPPALDVVCGGIGSNEDLRKNGSQHGPYDIPCLWPAPPDANSNLEISQLEMPPNVTSDLNKFLKLKKIPVRLGATDPQDVGSMIAGQIFASAGATRTTAFGKANTIMVNPMTVKDESTGVAITGGLAYYPVPVDDRGRAAWHSLFRVYYTTNDDARRSLMQSLKDNSIDAVASGPPSGASYNTVSIATVWSGTTGVESIMKSAVTAFVTGQGTKVGVLKDPINDGTTFTYQFWSLTSIPPGEVRAGLFSAINKLVNPSKNASSINAAMAAPSLPRLPTVKILSTITYLV